MPSIILGARNKAEGGRDRGREEVRKRRWKEGRIISLSNGIMCLQ